MYLLDTNVISELAKVSAGRVDGNFAAWAASVETARLLLSVVTTFELELGVLLMERRDARQGTKLRQWLEKHVLPAFDERILPVDLAVMRRCAALHLPDRRSDMDSLIAATALVHGMTVVTRNTADFAGSGVSLLNPWQ